MGGALIQHPSASFAFTARCRIVNRPGMLGQLTSAIGSVGGDIRALDIVRVEGSGIVRDITVLAADADHAQRLIKQMSSVPGVEVLEYSDRTFLAHLGGKIEVTPRHAIRTRDDLSMVYTPGVARICLAIAEDPRRVRNLTIKRNSVAIVSDGSAVLGLGNIGPEAAIPVMEGKSMLFKEFGNVDAFPLCLATQDVDEIVETVVNIAPIFGGINLEDIAAPRCFEIERRLTELLDIPVFHDDQHGTAIVVTAALINAAQDRRQAARGRADRVARRWRRGDGRHRSCCSRRASATSSASIARGSSAMACTDLSPAQHAYATITNRGHLAGGLREAITGADVFIGTSVGGALDPELVRLMAPSPVVFALANPEPEVQPEAIEGLAAVIATGRSDYPNQINNVLCFPGFFRGLLDCGAGQITDGMKLAAAHAIARVVGDDLHPEYIIPSVFNRDVAPAVAAAVSGEARRRGLAREYSELIDPLHGAGAGRDLVP